VDSIAFNYAQNFNSLFDNTNSMNLPWQNDSTLSGWSLFREKLGAETEPASIQTYEVSDFSSTIGRFYSFGTGASDRALGGIGHSTFGHFNNTVSGFGDDAVNGWIAVSFLNNTETTLTQFTANYTGEQWRDGGNDPPGPQTMEFEYGFGSTFATVVSWTKPGSLFNFTSPTFVSNSGPIALDGNDAANRISGRGGTVTGLDWQAGTTIWLRWTEKNDKFGDHGLAIDDFTFSVAAIPEPGAAIFGTVLFGLILFVEVARRLKSSLG
jgi:hypothetical protein